VACKRIGAHHEALTIIDSFSAADCTGNTAVTASPAADTASPANPAAVTAKPVNPVAALESQARPASATQVPRQRSLATLKKSSTTNEFVMMSILACAAAIAVRAPELFGVSLENEPDFYLRNLSVLVLPFLVGYFARTRNLSAGWTARLAALLAVSATVMNLYPFEGGDNPGDTLVLAAVHLPLLLWLAVGVAHCGGDWRNHEKRLEFVRFTGEWCIYFGLIAFGGSVLMSLTVGVFAVIGTNITDLVGLWLTPGAAAGAVVVAGWLADTRKGVLERLAPVLTRLFTPMFALLLFAFLAAAIISGSGIEASRELLITFDVLLVVVLALVLYSVAVRYQQASPGIFDIAQTALVIAALLADVFVLSVMVDRLSELGATPNRLAALGINLVLLVNLAGAAWLYIGFLRGRISFQRLERWQAGYAPVYAVWLTIVVAVLPLMFGFA